MIFVLNYCRPVVASIDKCATTIFRPILNHLDLKKQHLQYCTNTYDLRLISIDNTVP